MSATYLEIDLNLEQAILVEAILRVNAFSPLTKLTQPDRASLTNWHFVLMNKDISLFINVLDKTEGCYPRKIPLSPRCIKDTKIEVSSKVNIAWKTRPKGE